MKLRVRLRRPAAPSQRCRSVAPSGLRFRCVLPNFGPVSRNSEAALAPLEVRAKSARMSFVVDGRFEGIRLKVTDHRHHLVERLRPAPGGSAMVWTAASPA